MPPMLSVSSPTVLSVVLVVVSLLPGCIGEELAKSLIDHSGSSDNCPHCKGIDDAGQQNQPELLGVYSTSTSPREAISIDITSGTANTLGTMGDLGSWSGETFLSIDKRKIYAFGTPNGAQGVEQSLYVFDLELGKVVRSIAADFGRNLFLAGVDAQDQLIALRWSGSAEEVIRIDPTDGAVIVLGTMGDLTCWSGQAVLSRDLRLVYAHGKNSNLSDAEEKLYAFDLASTAFAYDIVAHYGQNLVLAGADAAERLVALRWNGSEEEVIRICSATGNIEVAGDMGAFSTWTQQTALSDDRATLYALGTVDPSASEQKLFAFDLLTGALAHDPMGSFYGINLAGYR